ncbi:MAG: HAD hydrolase-like protein [Fibrobacter sp.]|uniref:HAD-IIA family hydrolase n=1 Tax=Fibrobacter sp. TaxID=35828 RepID=UPI00388E0651|nr:HAD hydrolase-like protein [Fibrobacter sp.]
MDSLEVDIYRRYQSLVGMSCALDLQRCATLDLQKSAAPVPQKVFLSQIINRYDAFCFDGYGTLYNRGTFVYPGAKEWFSALREAGKQLRLVTNAASNVDAVLAAEACARGFDFTAEETISSGSLLKAYVRDGGYWPEGSLSESASSCREVYYIGRPTGVNVLAECGISAVENPLSPVVAVSSSTATDAMYSHAVQILQRPGAMLLVLNSDAWAPNIDGTRSPVSGALSERLRRDSACERNGFVCCKTEYFGKPFPAIWERVKSSLPNGSRVLMIGDTLGTDVFGAMVAGFDSALVVGRNVPAADLESDERALKIRPTYYLEP